jgi:histidine triad (HIT) family protein
VHLEECVFCKIARGEIPVNFVYEDECVVAFDDASPQAPVHTLVIPRDHYQHLGDVDAPAVLAALFGAVPLVAKAKGVAESGYRVVVNAGSDAGQSVSHLHVHVLGGKKMSHGMVAFRAE